MPLRPAAAGRRVQLALDRGEHPFRQGHSVYLNRIEGQVRLRNSDGHLTNAGREYINRGGDERLTHLVPPDAQTWRRGSEVLAYGIPDRHGAGRAFRVHSERNDGNHVLTHAGRLLAGPEVSEYVVRLPVYVRYKRGDGWSEPYSVNRRNEPITVPLDKIPGLEHYNRGYTEDGEDAIARDIKAATMEWIRQEAQGRDELVIYQESDCTYFVRPGEDIVDKPGWSFDVATTTRTHGRPETHVLLGLPRRGIIDMPDEMWGKLKLLPEAIRDYQSEGLNCVVQQIAVAFRERYKGRTGSSRDGAERTKEQVSQFSVAEVEWLLDGIFDGLYPGYFVDEAGNRRDPKRASVVMEVPRSLDGFAESWKEYMQRGKRYSLQELRTVVDKGNAKRFGIMGKAFHDALKRAFWGERDLLKMYRRFFSGYPSLYTVYEDFVAAAHHHYEGEDEECWNEPKAAPYTHAGWRELGPNSAMVVELCRRLGRRCRIIHNDTCIYEFLPENPSADSMIVWAIWGDHVFFYKDVKGVQHLKVMSSKDASAPVLQTRNEYDGDVAYKRVEYKDMEAWDSGRFMDLYNKKTGATFHTADIEAAAAWLRWKCVPFQPAWRDPNHMKSLTVTLPEKKVKIRVKSVSEHADLLQAICSEAARKFDAPFPYYGEEWGGLAVRIAEYLCMQHRPRSKPKCDTSGLCSVCGDPLGREVELHHPVQPRRGGDPEAVVPIHPECHAWITGLQKMGLNSTGAMSFYSELSPDETVAWEQTPKPRQICWGDGVDAQLHEVRCVDVKNCRPNMLYSTKRLPIFGPMDAQEPFCVDRFEEYDYLQVERPILKAYRDDDDLKDLAPYQGPQRYHVDVVKYMLDKRVITFDDIVYGLKASRWVAPEVLRNAFETMKDLVFKAWSPDWQTERFTVKGAQKTFVLACIGTMNRPPATEWTVRRSAEACDVPGATVVTIDLDKKKLPLRKVQRRVYDNRTALPIGLIALQKEVCAVDFAARCVRRLGMKIHGMVVDCVLFTGRKTGELRGELRGAEKYGYTYDTKLSFTVPKCPQGKAKLAPPRPPPKAWVRLDEQDEAEVDRMRSRVTLLDILRKAGLRFDITRRIAEFLGDSPLVGKNETIMQKLAALAAANQGALVTGKPGTGKTKFLAELIKTWEAMEAVHFVCGAYTHAASRLMPKGRTLEHWRRAYGRRVPDKTVMAIDEVNMVGISFLAMLGRMQHLGLKFVLMGDFEGQELPLFDGWQCDRIGDTDLVRQLGNALHITLSRNRRYNDDKLWLVICRLYDHIDNPTLVEQVQRVYPWQGEAPDLCIVKSHWKRRRVNAFLNQRDSDGVLIKSVGKLKGTAMQPQSMWVKPGTILMGCAAGCKKILSGLEYEVKSADAETVVVSMRAPWRTSDQLRATMDAKSLEAARRLEDDISLTHEETSRWLRLAYAITYYSVEGRTIPDRTVLLLDTASVFYTNRNLIVGISRAKEGRQVKIPTPGQEALWLAAMPDVPEEEDKSAPEEVFQAEEVEALAD